MMTLSIWLVITGGWTIFGSQTLKDDEGRKPVTIFSTVGMIVGCLI